MSTLLCLGGGKAIALAAGLFTLSWTHSVEKVAWQERWEVTADGLMLREARVKGSGAGMEPADGARREAGWWIWEPQGKPLAELVLAASGDTGAGWTLCHAKGCEELGRREGEPIALRPCSEARARLKEHGQ